jgi:hypothetical protein
MKGKHAQWRAFDCFPDKQISEEILTEMNEVFLINAETPFRVLSFGGNINYWLINDLNELLIITIITVKKSRI